MGMPISNVASRYATQQLQGANAWQQRRQSFDALAKALQSGDVSAAKQAYTKLSSTYPPAAGNNPNSPLAKLGQALQSGNLSAAQSLFAQMRGHHHHKGGASVATSSPASSSPTAGGLVGSNINVMA